jgi:hypothetical protein
MKSVIEKDPRHHSAAHQRGLGRFGRLVIILQRHQLKAALFDAQGKPFPRRRSALNLSYTRCGAKSRTRSFLIGPSWLDLTGGREGSQIRCPSAKDYVTILCDDEIQFVRPSVRTFSYTGVFKGCLSETAWASGALAGSVTDTRAYGSGWWFIATKIYTPCWRLSRSAMPRSS